MEYYVYILKSLKDNNHYIGSSQNPSKRLKEHNSGNNKSTKPRRPFVLLWKKKFSTRQEATKYEYFLKSPKGYKEKRKIIDARP